MGRVISVTNPDGTFATKDYVLGTTVSIDANGHKKEADSDAYGRLRQVREYTGAYPNFTLYATTSYNYNVLGNLDNVIDTSGHVTTIGYDTLSRKTSMSDPDMGDWTYQYDANSNLTSQTDAKGQTITFVYDALNRLTTKRYPTGPDVTYTYDETFSTNPKGRLTTVTDLSGTTKFYYDKLGRTTKTIKTVDSVDYTTESEYDALGRTTSVTYPDPGRETVNYTYDNGGNLSTVTGYATYSNYNALGQAGLVTYGNGADTVYQFDSLNNRLFSITTNSQGQGRQNLTYAYDNVGNIQTITDLLDSNRSQGFQYDELNRLTQAQSTSYGTITHTFDPIGNITYNSQVGNYTYSTTQPHAVVQAGAYTYSYDANGNMTGRLGGTLTYDYENRLSSLTNGGSTTSFVYDASGGRVKKITPSSTTAYIGNLYECTSGVCTKHIFAGGNRIVTKNPSATYFYHTDHLRSSSVITDASGAKVEEIYYFPFGATRLNSGSVNLKHKYTGQEEDAETGLYYYGARYYDPAIGRFVSADTIIPDPTNPQAFNRYSYVLNNPLIYIDPTGHGNFFRDIAKPFEHLGHWVKEHKREVITAAIIVLAYEFGPGLIDSIQAGASDTAYLPTQVAGPDMITVETSPSAGGVRISLGKVGETIGKVGEAIGGALKSAATYIANNPGIAAIPAAAGGAYYASDAFAAGGGGNNGGSGKSAGTGNNHFQNFGNNPTHSKDHSIPWYLDMNVSYGTPIGIGPTGGIQINDSGNYPYLGGGFMFPGPSGSLTVSPMSPSPGWNFAVQGQRGISGQLGTDRFGNPFAEGGLAWKRGWSITAFYVFGPFTPIEPMPAP
ncbi:MAG: RHS repeat protein [Deltaproteobacteria bacterium]|nr:RHS repeat protein [Deltaproteobacteria bacterium]